MSNEKLVAYWFVYTPDGEPIFLAALADIDGDTAFGNLHQYSGIRFGEFDHETLSKEVWGSILITFIGCDAATVTYNSTATHLGVPYGSGTIDLTRLTGIRGLDCIEPQSLTEYGNYVANVIEEGVDIGDAEIIILKNGAMAYRFSISDVYRESGFGQLTMTSDTEFDFVTSVEYYGHYRELFSDKFNFWGNGSFSSNSVSMEVPYGLLLQGAIDPAVYAGMTMAQLAGTYSGTLPGDMIPHVTLHIAEDGSVSGTLNVFYDYQVTGEVTIPDPGMNQFQLQFQYSVDGYNQSFSSIGTIRGGEMDLITKGMDDDENWGTFKWTLSKH